MAKENFSNLTENYGDTLSIKQTAEYLDISTKTAYKMIKKGEIKAKRVGRKWRIPAFRLIEYLGG